MKRPLLIASLLVAVIAVIAFVKSQYRDRVQEGEADYAAAAAASAGTAADKALLASLDTWSYRSANDPMVTNGVNRFASIISTNSVNFGFPYSGEQSAVLTIRKMAASQSDWKDAPPYDVMISIDRGQLLSGDQGSIETKIDNEDAVTFQAVQPADNDTTTLFFGDEPKVVFGPRQKNGHYAFIRNVYPLQSFLDKLQHAKTLKVEVTAYQNGEPVFIFNVSGFDLKRLSGAAPNAPAVASGVR